MDLETLAEELHEFQPFVSMQECREVAAQILDPEWF